MARRALLWIIAPVMIIALDAGFYYLSDWLHSGRWFTYIDAYGSGYFTWWLDSEQFWGNFELWTAIGVFTGIYGLYAAGTTAGSTWLSRRHGMMAMLAIAVTIAAFELVLGLAGILFPAPFTIGEILVDGWYGTYFQLHAMTVLLIGTGAGIYLAKLFFIKQKREFMPINSAMAASILAIALVFLHATIVSSWNAAALNQVNYAITDLVGYLFVVLPIFAILTSLFEKEKGKPDVKHENLDQLTHNRARNIILYPIIAAGLLLAFIAWILNTGGFNMAIAITSQFVPKNMITWLYTATIATLFYFAGQWKGTEGSS